MVGSDKNGDGGSDRDGGNDSKAGNDRNDRHNGNDSDSGKMTGLLQPRRLTTFSLLWMGCWLASRQATTVPGLYNKNGWHRKAVRLWA